jgi:hypothetical protein
VFRCVDQHPAPAAADVDKCFSGLQLKFSANVFVLLLLGLLERVVLMTEVGTGVCHALIKPQLVEVIPTIVMMGDVFLRTRDCIERCLAQMPKCKLRFQREGQIKERGVCSETKELSEISLHLNISCHILFAEAQRSAFKNMFSRALRHKGENELCLIGTIRLFHSIPELHLKRHISHMIAQLFEELLKGFSHDRPLPGDRTLLLKGLERPRQAPTGACD